MRFAYWIGMRRWPSCTKTTATTMPIAISGKKSFSIGPPLIQALMPCGADVRIDAKISSEMPLPMPRFVISSPIHIRSTRPGGQRDDDQHEPARVDRRGRPSA